LQREPCVEVNGREKALGAHCKRQRIMVPARRWAAKKRGAFHMEQHAEHSARGIQHPFFLMFLILMVMFVASTAPFMGLTLSFLIGFDAAAALFILVTSVRMGPASPASLRLHAARDDAGRVLLLLIVALLLAVILVVIAQEMGRHGKANGQEVVLVVLTLTIAWTFGNLVCALHYTRMFYDVLPGGGDHAGLLFPGADAPDFWDFCYFAFVLGMTFQVSDVQIFSKRIRRTATAHALLAFFFNIGVVALTVNLIAGAI
jgi:uncharacterized membrane protein